jgi:hypothetical protein
MRSTTKLFSSLLVTNMTSMPSRIPTSFSISTSNVRGLLPSLVGGTGGRLVIWRAANDV